MCESFTSMSFKPNMEPGTWYIFNMANWMLWHSQVCLLFRMALIRKWVLFSLSLVSKEGEENLYGIKSNTASGSMWRTSASLLLGFRKGATTSKSLCHLASSVRLAYQEKHHVTQQDTPIFLNILWACYRKKVFDYKSL